MQKTISLIDLSAIRRNALHMKSLACGAKFYAVVKADAYGHGAIEVAKELSDVCDGFCVAIADEGGRIKSLSRFSPIARSLQARDPYGWAVLISAPKEERDAVSRAASRVLGF